MEQHSGGRTEAGGAVSTDWRESEGICRPRGADGASATALQPPPHLLTTLPAPAGGGRCGVVPLEGDLGERPGRSPRT